MAEQNETKEYVTFEVRTRDGSLVEMAAVDEFEFKNKYYVVGALIKDDVVMEEDGVYIYRMIPKDDDFDVQPITSSVEMREVSEAYAEME